MARNEVDVSATSSVDLADVIGRLYDDERKVLRQHGKNWLTIAKGEWVGWLYTGRPADAPRLVSHDAWKMTIQSTENPFSMTLANAARDYRTGTKAYASYVHRAGKTEPEWKVLMERLITDELPKLVVALRDATLKNFGAVRPVKKLRTKNKNAAVFAGGGGTVL